MARREENIQGRHIFLLRDGHYLLVQQFPVYDLLPSAALHRARNLENPCLLQHQLTEPDVQRVRPLHYVEGCALLRSDYRMPVSAPVQGSNNDHKSRLMRKK